VAGYSGTPLAKKLGIKPGMTAFLHAAPAPVMAELGAALGEVQIARSLQPELDMILGFVRSKSELKRDLARWKKHLAKSGCLWVSWPKKASGLETDLSDTVVREIGLQAALVDTKVCAVDTTWSGLKFVYRKNDR
jgi:hypothetical protein